MASDFNHRALLVSFSGLDGSGKSTQIASLTSQLHMVGLTTKHLAFWDNVVVGTRYREEFVHRAYGSQKGIGAPDKPVERRDKNVSKGYLTFARHALYFADAMHLCSVVRRAIGSGADVVIMDRYIWDELANLPLDNPLSQRYVRMVQKMVPRPDVSYLLDADPEEARKRKPEYPVDFMHKSRRKYFKLNALLNNALTVIPPLPLEEAKVQVVRAFMEAEPARRVLMDATKKRAGVGSAA